MLNTTITYPDQEQYALRILSYWNRELPCGGSGGMPVYMTEQGDKCVLGGFMTEEHALRFKENSTSIDRLSDDLDYLWTNVTRMYASAVQSLHDYIYHLDSVPGALTDVKYYLCVLIQTSEEPAASIYRQILEQAVNDERPGKVVKPQREFVLI